MKNPTVTFSISPSTDACVIFNNIYISIPLFASTNLGKSFARNFMSLRVKSKFVLRRQQKNLKANPVFAKQNYQPTQHNPCCARNKVEFVSFGIKRESLESQYNRALV